MVALHPGTGAAASGMETLTGYDALAEEKGFVVAYPDSQNGGWHIGCCTAERRSADDLEFIDAMIEHLISTANVDPRRVYVTGFSVGAYMAYRMACESPWSPAPGRPAARRSSRLPARPSIRSHLRDPRDQGLLRRQLRGPDRIRR